MGDAAEVDRLTGIIVTTIGAMRRDMEEPCVSKLHTIQEALGMQAGSGPFGNTPVKDVVTAVPSNKIRLQFQKAPLVRAGAPLYPLWNSAEGGKDSFLGWMNVNNDNKFGIIGQAADSTLGSQIGGWWVVKVEGTDGSGNPVVSLKGPTTGTKQFSDPDISGKSLRFPPS